MKCSGYLLLPLQTVGAACDGIGTGSDAGVEGCAGVGPEGLAMLDFIVAPAKKDEGYKT
jgi:hypothetical protein